MLSWNNFDKKVTAIHAQIFMHYFVDMKMSKSMFANAKNIMSRLILYEIFYHSRIIYLQLSRTT